MGRIRGVEPLRIEGAEGGGGVGGESFAAKFDSPRVQVEIFFGRLFPREVLFHGPADDLFTSEGVFVGFDTADNGG